MQDDAVKLEETHAWLVKAQRDLQAAEVLLTQHNPLLDVVAYHCQQSAEKALKGFLVWHDVPFRKTHDLEDVLAQCITIDQTLSTLREIAKRLTPLVSDFRYPGDVLEPPLADAQDAFARAKTVLDAIVERLPSEVSPSA